MGLLLGLENPEQLPVITRTELEQLVAAIQTGFNNTSQAGNALCIVTNSSTQAIPDNVIPMTPITFDTNESDALQMHAAGGSRFYIPEGQGGAYQLKCVGFFAANATGQRIIKVRKNGATDVIGGGNFVGNPSAVFGATPAYASDVVLAAGDYIEFLVHQNSGAPLNFGAANLFYSTRASVVRIA